MRNYAMGFCALAWRNEPPNQSQRHSRTVRSRRPSRYCDRPGAPAVLTAKQEDRDRPFYPGAPRGIDEAARNIHRLLERQAASRAMPDALAQPADPTGSQLAQANSADSAVAEDPLVGWPASEPILDRILQRNDSQGRGAYGASRTGHRHHGIDFAHPPARPSTRRSTAQSTASAGRTRTMSARTTGCARFTSSGRMVTASSFCMSSRLPDCGWATRWRAAVSSVRCKAGRACRTRRATRIRRRASGSPTTFTWRSETIAARASIRRRGSTGGSTRARDAGSCSESKIALSGRRPREVWTGSPGRTMPLQSAGPHIAATGKTSASRSCAGRFILDDEA
jgi:hypothetical protein